MIKGKNMNGNFKDEKNKFAVFGVCTTLLVSMIISAIIVSKYHLILLQIPAAFVALFLSLAVGNLLSKGKFSADEKSVLFHVGFFKYEYFYNNISDIKIKTGLTHVKNRSYAHIEFIIKLKMAKQLYFMTVIYLMMH
ncbi:MAG: hypothetical protein K2O36_02070 [Ruminococcus sp.]|nr:hypothetical protein [Ruminococcus sp.]